MKTHAELKDELLRDPEVRREYERLGPEFELIRSLVAAGSSAPDRLCAQAGLEDAGQAIGGEDKNPSSYNEKRYKRLRWRHGCAGRGWTTG